MGFKYISAAHTTTPGYVQCIYMCNFLDAIGEKGGGRQTEKEREREREERPTIDGDAESESGCSLHRHLKGPRRWHDGVVDVEHHLHLNDIAGLLDQLHSLLQRHSLRPNSIDG